jgi:membrane protease YdiL (CAAX protease family)
MSRVLDLVFLVFLLVVVPRAAFRSARIFGGRAAGTGARPQAVPSREQILLSTIFSLSILGALSWFTARLDGFDLLACPAIGSRELLAGAAVLALHFVLRQVSIALRTEQERRNLPSNAWMPRTPRQWLLYVTACVLAGLCEEAAYRGVLMWIVVPHIGLVPAALLSASAFALAHAVQRWKAAVVVFLMALSQHWLVVTTGTLFVAMVVHATYDLAAGLLRARRLAREAAATP